MGLGDGGGHERRPPARPAGPVRRRLTAPAVGLAGLLVVDAPAPAAPAAAEIVAELERGEHPGFESFLFDVDGEAQARWVAPALARRDPDLRSATKSITALLVGVAVDRGRLSVDDRAADLLPAYREVLLADPLKAAITVEDLLTMRSGLACDDGDRASPGHEDRMYRRRDWLAFWASRPMAQPPGEAFSYCTGNVVALGEILATVAGADAEAFAAEHLFGPLGIEDATWERWDRGRRVDTGGHLRLAPDDLARIGALVLDRGAFEGRRVVSEAWIDAMTRPRAEAPGGHGYGYLWWLDRVHDPALPATEVWWAQGNGGTLLVVLPRVDAVMTITGTRFGRPDALEPMSWLRDRLLPELAPAAE